MNPTYLELLEKHNNNSFPNRIQKRLFETLNLALSQPYLYRYYSPKYGLQTLENPLIYFNNPKNFNDVRDCSPKLLNVSDSYLDEMVEKHIKENYPGKFHQKLIKDQLKNKDFKHKLYREGKEKVILEIVRKLGITCFTLSNDNELMWTHYTSNHTGLCIEFDYQKMILYFKKIQDIARIALYKIEYVSDIAKINIEKEFSNDQIMDWLTTKLSKYQYEDELRAIIYQVDDNRSISIPENLITGVYLGYNIEGSLKDKVKSLMTDKYQNIPLYQMDFDDKLNLKPHQLQI